MDDCNNNLSLSESEKNESARLRERVAQLEAERDTYRRSLATLLRELCASTDPSNDEELDRLAGEALRLTDFRDELRQLLQGR